MLPVMPQLPALSGASLTNLKAIPVDIPSGVTQKVAQAATLDAVHTARGGTTGTYLMVSITSSSPYIAATLYNANTNVTTNLTISGALGESPQDDGWQQLAYSSEQDKWYLLSGYTAAQKIYPLTLSGTTLTIGTAINAAAEFTSAGCATLLMTSDLTDLFLLDISDGVMKKYDTSAGTWGGALTAPDSGYETTDQTNTCFHYSNGNIYMLSSDADAGNPNYFEAYNVSGNSWSAKTVPKDIEIADAGSVCMIADPDDDSLIYFWSGYDSGYPTPAIVKWTKATDASKFVISTTDLNNRLYDPDLTADNGWSAYPGLSATQPFYGKRGGFLDISNDDIVCIHGTGAKILNYGKNFGRKQIFTYSGSGELVGLQAMTNISSNINGQLAMKNVIFYITIDGGTEYEIAVQGMKLGQLLNDFKLPFSTSITIEAMAASGTRGLVYHTTNATIFLNIIT